MPAMRIHPAAPHIVEAEPGKADCQSGEGEPDRVRHVAPCAVAAEHRYAQHAECDADTKCGDKNGEPGLASLENVIRECFAEREQRTPAEQCHRHTEYDLDGRWNCA